MLPIKIDTREFELLYYNIMADYTVPLCLAISSVKEASGNSCLSYALARRMAASDHKVLLIDLNIEKPDLSELLAAKQTEWSPENFDSNAFVERLGDTGLSIMAAPLQSAELWSFREKKILSEMISQLKKEYDVIIIDIPHLLSEQNTQALIASEIICAVCDTTILNLLSGKVSENDIVNCTHLLKKSGARLHGFVMNDQFHPSLKDEICRELDRIKFLLPRFVEKMKAKVRANIFLSQEI